MHTKLFYTSPASFLWKVGKPYQPAEQSLFWCRLEQALGFPATQHRSCRDTSIAISAEGDFCTFQAEGVYLHSSPLQIAWNIRCYATGREGWRIIMLQFFSSSLLLDAALLMVMVVSPANHTYIISPLPFSRLAIKGKERGALYIAPLANLHSEQKPSSNKRHDYAKSSYPAILSPEVGQYTLFSGSSK
mmetsp:Transcript_6182/g.10979  ORF Transcript_6182/g.10979 Transcript_6182/m.10979 type:complete len:189 (-) Transcript_6182:515-1081(-)